jgi:flagellum-specific peptidoglycan hydrolase FlgJ
MYSPYLLGRVKKFYALYGLGIAKAIKGTGLFLPTVVGQSAGESDYGEKIPQNSFNFGGIKYNPNLEGVVGYVDALTTEKIGGKKVKVMGRFSKFKDAESGFKAHVKVLMLPRYDNARLNAKTPEEQLVLIAKSGYTTTPINEYSALINPIIEATRDYTKIGRIS